MLALGIQSRRSGTCDERIGVAARCRRRRFATPRCDVLPNQRHATCSANERPILLVCDGYGIAERACYTASTMRPLIKNATGRLADGIERVSVVIEGARIADIDPAPQLRVDEVIDASGPASAARRDRRPGPLPRAGLTHKEDLATASRACAKGGVTTFLEMPNTVPPATTQARLEEKLALAAQKSLVNYGFYIGATPTTSTS